MTSRPYSRSRYYQVTGPTVGQYLLVDACEPIATGVDEADVRAIGDRLTAL